MPRSKAYLCSIQNWRTFYLGNVTAEKIQKAFSVLIF